MANHLKPVSDKQIDLALAWLSDQATLKAVHQELQLTSINYAYTRIAMILREAYRRDRIQLQSKPNASA